MIHSKLINSIISNKISEEEIINLIKIEPDINAKYDDDKTALMYALEYKYSIKIIEAFIENRADVNSKKVNGGTPLMLALKFISSEQIVKLLIENGANVNATFPDTQTTLMYAVGSKFSIKIIKILIENGANVNGTKKDGSTVLLYAFKLNNSEDVIKLLIENGADLNKFYKNVTILMYAIVKKYSDNILQLLIENGADVNSIDIDSGNSILSYALQYNISKNIIKLMIKKGADVNYIDKKNINQTILMYALINNTSHDIINLLIENKADVNSMDKNHETILMYALKNNASEYIINLLIENKADVNSMDITHETILMYALKNNASNTIINLLVENGADVHAINRKGDTILLYSLIYFPSEDIIKLFIEKAADVNVALNYAIQHNLSKRIIRLLNEKTDKVSSTLQRRSKYDLKYIGKNTLCNTLFEKFEQPLKNKLIFLCNRTNLTEETVLNTSETKSKIKKLKDEEQNKKTKIKLKDTEEELNKIYSLSSNNIENYYIQYPGDGIDAGGLKTQFFTLAMEQMLSKYFEPIEGTDIYKLKDTITKEEASKAGFLVAFSLINDMPFTKHINNIYIAKMMYKVRQLSVDDYFLYAILDMNENGRKIFQNTCSDADLLKDYCNPTTYFKEYILSSYGLRNKNLPVFIKSFNLHISKKFLSENKINIYDISKILTNTKITKADLTTILNTMKLNKINPDDKWLNIYDNLYAIMVDLDSSQYKKWLNECPLDSKQKLELSSMNKFYKKLLFFWTSLYSINTNMIPYYSIHYTSTGKHIKAHTCSNQLDIPEYKNPEEMFKYLIDSIYSANSKDFGIA